MCAHTPSYHAHCMSTCVYSMNEPVCLGGFPLEGIKSMYNSHSLPLPLPLWWVFCRYTKACIAIMSKLGFESWHTDIDMLQSRPSRMRLRAKTDQSTVDFCIPSGTSSSSSSSTADHEASDMATIQQWAHAYKSRVCTTYTIICVGIVYIQQHAYSSEADMCVTAIRNPVISHMVVLIDAEGKQTPQTTMGGSVSHECSPLDER